MVPGLGNRKVLSLFRSNPHLEYQDMLGSLESPEISRVIRNASIVERLQEPGYLARLIEAAEKMQAMHAQQDITVLTIADDAYPATLRAIADAPTALYCKGNVNALKNINSVAIIGTRHPTPKGTEVATKIAQIFARRGFAVVSGLAKGIDTAGHQGALSAKGVTIAVMAGSLDKVYPKENIGLAQEILHNNGVLVSEHPLGTLTRRTDFVNRDRIQSGLSLGVCTVQTDVNGGSMHTVRYAHAQQRLLFYPRIKEDDSLPVYQGILKIKREYQAEELARSEDYQRLANIMTTTIMPRVLAMARGTILAADSQKESRHHPDMLVSQFVQLVAIPQESEGSPRFRRLLRDLQGEAMRAGLTREQVIERLTATWPKNSGDAEHDL